MREKKSALITGITGQDGSYLAELLLEKGYDVYGLVRRTSTPNTTRIDHIRDRIHLTEGDVTDSSSIAHALEVSQPHEVYHLAAQSFVGTSWTQPVLTAEVTGLSTLKILDEIKKSALPIRFYQASSSEQFGSSPAPQNEDTPFKPRSPYGVAKCFAHHITVNYRESFGLHASCGILFNHESPRRGPEFVTRKITKAVAAIAHGKQDYLYLGNLDAKRDWGHAKDYVKAMWLMLQQPCPDDYVIASGRTATVRDFVKEAFGAMDYTKYVRIDPKFYRPADVEYLQGDPSYAEQVLGWKRTYSLRHLVKEMVIEDMRTG